MTNNSNTNYSRIIDALIAEKRSELSNLFAPNALSSLGPNLETLLEEHPDDSVVKILWSLAQNQSGELPLPFVASSLLELIQNQELLNLHPRLCFLVSELVSENLISAGELRSAIFLLADFVIKPRPEFYHEINEWKQTKQHLLDIIENEKTLALKKREPSSYLNSLTELSSKLQKAKAPSIKASNIISSQEISKSVLTKVTEDTNYSALEQEFTLGDPQNIDTKNFDLKQNHPSNRNSSRLNNKLKNSKSTFLIGIMLVLGVVIGMNIEKITLFISNSNIINSKDQNTQLAFETRIKDFGHPQYPQIKPFSLTDLSPSLDEINKRLERISVNRETKSQETAEPTAVNTPIIDQTEIESLNNIPDKDASQTPTSPVPKLPNIPDNMGTAIDLGSNSKITTTTGQGASGVTSDSATLRKGPDGRTYGPPQIIDPTIGKQSERALDGSPLKSYEVEKFDPPLVYETITATNVLAAPSLMSAPITRLKSATPIHVTATMGFWLELRSNEGKIGYIFAQDAVKK